MKRLISLGLVLAAAGGFLAYRRAAGSYNYYANTSGSVTYSSGSTGTENLYWIISTAAVPDGTSSYEVNVQTGPSCVAGRKQYQLFGASPDFSGHQWTMTGSAVVLEMDHGDCSSTGVSFRVYHVIGSSWQLMASNTGLSYMGNQAWRSVYNYDGVNYSLGSRIGNTWVAGNYAQIYWGSGKPGTGSNNSSVPTTALFGPLDRVKPSAPVQAQMTAVTGYDWALLSWPPASDDVNGTGVLEYFVSSWPLIYSTTGTSQTLQPLTPGVSRIVGVLARDFHGNESLYSQISVTPGAPNVPRDTARRVGVHSLGSYWGSMGENVDLQSGNVNFTVPILSARLRAGGQVPFALSYNSQHWTRSGSTIFQHSSDVGFGHGWRLLAGSITPMYVGGSIGYYLFTDSTGAEYRLNLQSQGKWTSGEGFWGTWVPAENKLYFNDGSAWTMGCVTSAQEFDAGTRYPTEIKDSNGNIVGISYQAGKGVTDVNTSARITGIRDVDVYGNSTFTFTYNTDATPHLISLTGPTNAGVDKTFTYSVPHNLTAPFWPFTGAATVVDLASIQQTGTGLKHDFLYNNSSELTKVTFPYRGEMSYSYTPFTFSPTNTTINTVDYRYLVKQAGAPQVAYRVNRNANDASQYMFTEARIDDPSGVGSKTWLFSSAADYTRGYLTQLDEKTANGGAVLRRHVYAYDRLTSGNAYLKAVNTTLDPGSANAKEMRTDQTLDIHGNVKQSRLFEFGNLTTPAKTVECTFYHEVYPSQGYQAAYLLRLPYYCGATGGGSGVTLFNRWYDQSTVSSVSGQFFGHDTANYGTARTVRGNLTTSSEPGRWMSLTYNWFGEAITASDGAGRQVAYNYSSASSFVAPTQITPNSNANLQVTMNYNNWFAPTTSSSPNGSQTTTTYNGFGRVTGRSDSDGVSVAVTYDDAARQVKETHGQRFTRTTYDGLGRPVKVETGDNAGTKTIAETEYDSCACTPVGKLKRQSLPYAPGGSPLWTTYVYDGLGRTLQVQQPNGSGTTQYAYAGNTVTVTDPAGKWKKYTSNASGSLVQVTEPNPAGGANYETYYTYNLVGKLTQVSMPRPTGTGTVTQVRSFVYDTTSGTFLQSQTHPESGTTTFGYHGDGRLAWKQDAKGQRVEYSYDMYGRLTTVTPKAAGGTVQTCDVYNYVYDQSANTYGRLAYVEWGNANTATCAKGLHRETFSYTAMGKVTSKNFTLTQNALSASLLMQYGYNSLGLLSQVVYPATVTGSGVAVPGRIYNYTYDTMNRPVGETEQLNGGAPALALVDNVTYGTGDVMQQMRWYPTAGGSATLTESRTYDALYQLTSIRTKNQANVDQMYVEYRFAAVNNDGRITSMKDYVTGEEVVYQYDALQRLASAATVGPEWGLSWSYDGFGNRLTQAVTKGSAPVQNILVDAGTNRVQSWSYDANGNATSIPGTGTLTYDVLNRVKTVAGESYEYGPGNLRMWRGNTLVLWGAGGERVGEYQLVFYSGTMGWQQLKSDVYFAGRRLQVVDRLGSVRSEGGTVRSYFPYGEERTSTANGADKFGTYYRDSSGLDYAQQRYYVPGSGRFVSVDPAAESGLLDDPISINRYDYTRADPANAHDPEGLDPVRLPGPVPIRDPNCSTYLIEGLFAAFGTTDIVGYLNTTTGVLGITTFLEHQGSGQQFVNTWGAFGWLAVNRTRNTLHLPRPTTMDAAIFGMSSFWTTTFGGERVLGSRGVTNLWNVLTGPLNDICRGFAASLGTARRVLLTAQGFTDGFLPFLNPIGNATAAFYCRPDAFQNPQLSDERCRQIPFRPFGEYFQQVTSQIDTLPGWSFWEPLPIPPPTYPSTPMRGSGGSGGGRKRNENQ